MSFQPEFSVRIAHRSLKRTATTPNSTGILCPNRASKPEEDSHKCHFNRNSLFELRIEA